MPGRTVDPFYVPLVVTTPAGTTAAAPLSTPAGTPHGTLLTIELLIPYGHAGATGICFELAGQQIIPATVGRSWIFGDGLDRDFAVDLEIDRGFNVITHNVGNYVHAHYLRFKMTAQVSSVLPGPVTLLPLSRLEGS